MADVVLNPGSAGLTGAGAPRVTAASGPVVLLPTGIDCRPYIGEPVAAVGEGPTDLTLALDGINLGSWPGAHSIHAPVLTPGTFQPAGICVGG